MANIPKPSVVIRTYFRPSPPPPVSNVLAPGLIGPLYRIKQYSGSQLWDGSSTVSIVLSDYNSSVESLDIDYTEAHMSLVLGAKTYDLPVEITLNYNTANPPSVTVNNDQLTITNLTAFPLVLPKDIVEFDTPLISKGRIKNVYGSYSSSTQTYTLNIVFENPVASNVNHTIDISQVHIKTIAPEVSGSDVILYDRVRELVWTIDGTTITASGNTPITGQITIQNAGSTTAITDSRILPGDTVTITYNTNSTITGTVVSTNETTTYSEIIVDVGTDTTGWTFNKVELAKTIASSYEGYPSVYARYRVTSVSELPLIVTDEVAFYEQYGNPTPDNPMVEAVKWIRQAGASDVPIYCYPVATDDAAGYSAVLNEMYKERYSYAIVPLTNNYNLVDQVASAIEDMNSETKNIVKRIITFYEIDQHTEIDKDLNNTTASYTNSTKTISGVTFSSTPLAGDKIKIDTGTITATLTVSSYDANTGNITVEEYLGTDLSASASQAWNVYLLRDVYQAKNALKQTIIAFLKKYDSIHTDVLVGHVYGEDASGNLQEVPMMFVAAEYAGMIAAYPPQVHFNLKQLPGIVYSDRLWDIYSDLDPNTSELNDIAGEGAVLIVQDTKYDRPYIRNQLTTDTTSVRTRNLSVVKSVDYVKRILYDDLKSLLQQGYNFGGGIVMAINLLMQARIRQFKDYKVDRYGSIVRNGAVKEIIEDPNTETLKVVVTMDFPEPVGRIEMELYVE